MAQKTIAQEEEDLEPGDELFLIEQYTNEDGTVQCKVLGWEREHGKVIVHGMTPWGDRFEHMMDWPQRNDRESYQFVRLCEAAGYTLGQGEELNSDDDVWIKAEQTRDQFKFDPEDPPEPEPTRRERAAERTERIRDGFKRLGKILGAYVLFMTWTIGFLLLYAFFAEEVVDDVGEDDIVAVYVFGHFAMGIIWLASYIGAIVLLEGAAMLL